MKRILSILIAMMMAGVILVGCNNNEPVNTDEKGGDPVQTSFELEKPVNVNTLGEPGMALGSFSGLDDGESKAYLQATDKLVAALMGEKGNSAVTPFSLYIALSMLAGGAEGETQQQLCDLLGLDADGLAALNVKLMQLGNSDVMNTVNSLWVQHGWPVEEDYVKLLGEQYLAWVNSVDFSDGSASGQIAGWINEQTDGMLSPQLQLPEETVMALVNATLLQDEWVNNFDKESTVQQTFHAPDGDVEVDMMKKENIGVTSWMGDGYRAVSLPLKEAEMIFLLPDEDSSPQKLLKEQPLSRLFNLDDSTETKYPHIELGIPKFDISGGGSANDALKALGIELAFDDKKAGFAPMSSEPVWVGNVAHGTRVIVHEDGVAAAGYTLIAMEGAAAQLPEIEQPFILDRPFLFCISKHGLPLFAGVVDQPNKTGTVVAPGAELENGIPVKDKAGIEGKLEEYFRLLPILDAEIKQNPDGRGGLDVPVYSSDTLHELEFLLQSEQLLADINSINTLKMAYFADGYNEEEPLSEFKVEFGELSISEETDMGTTATQQLKLVNNNGWANATATLTRVFGDAEWYIVDLELPAQLLGIVEQKYYEYKAEYLADNTGDYDIAALQSFVMERAAGVLGLKAE